MGSHVVYWKQLCVRYICLGGGHMMKENSYNLMLCPLLTVSQVQMLLAQDIVLRIIIEYSPFKGFYPLETR